MLFRSTSTNEVQIGRRHSDDTDRADDSKALFGCPVVSRKHAVLVFSEDTGNAYIVDKGSHHGTYMRRRGESGLPRRLEAEQSVLLRDGDTITLGKTVGRSSQDRVTPVVFRIELLYGTIDSMTPEDSPIASNTGTPPKRISSSLLSRRGSGRFSARDLVSDDDQDVVEIEQPRARRADLRNIISHISDSLSYCKPASDIADMDDDGSISDSARSSPMDLSSPSPRPASVDFPRSAPATDGPGSQEFAQRQRVDTQASWPAFTVNRSPSPEDLSLEDMDEDELSEESPQPEPVQFGAQVPNDDETLRKRIDELQAEMARLQAHRRKIKSKFNANTHAISKRLAVLDSKASMAKVQFSQLSGKLDAVEEQYREANERLNTSSGRMDGLDGRVNGFDERADDLDKRVGRLDDLNARMEDRLEDDSERISSVQDGVTELRQELMEVDGRQEDLQGHYDALKERQGELREEQGELRDEVKDLRHRAALAEEAHAALLAKHEALQRQYAALDGVVGCMRGELDNVVQGDMSTLEARVAVLDVRANAAEATEEGRVSPEELINELKALRAAAEQRAEADAERSSAHAERIAAETARLSAESENVRAAMAELKQLQAEVRADIARASQTKGPAPLSSKRKRNDEDEGIDGEEEEMLPGSQATTQEDLSLLSDASDADEAGRTVNRAGRPKTKRPRQVSGTIARTAVTATVGAALTWTALAYC